MTQEELLKQIRTILNELPFGETGYLYKQTAFDACVKTAEWLQEQMMKDAIEGKVVAVRNVMNDRLHTYPWIELEAQLSKNDKVKVIIIKE